jgi:hypothetical protein
MYRIRPARGSGQPSGAVIPCLPTAKSMSFGKTTGQKSLQRSYTHLRKAREIFQRMAMHSDADRVHILPAAYFRFYGIINDITIPRDLPGLTGNHALVIMCG